MALHHWYADGRKGAVDTYDDSDFEISAAALRYQKERERDAALLTLIAAETYDEWYKYQLAEAALEKAWMKQNKAEIEEDEEVDGVKPAAAFAAFQSGYRTSTIPLLEMSILEAVENLDDDDDDEARAVDGDDDEDDEDEEEEDEDDDEEDEDEEGEDDDEDDDDE